MIGVQSYSSAWIDRYCALKRHSLIANYYALCVLSHFCGNEAMFKLEPGPGVLHVCTGGALRINCSTNTDLLEWNVTIPSKQREIIRSFQRGIALTTTQSFVLNVSLTSNSSPLISTLSADNVMAADLNGTLITCSGFNFLDDGVFTSASVQLNLVGINGGNVNVTSTMNISEQFEANSVIVTLEWTTKHGVAYSFNVDPQVTVNHTGRNSAQLAVSFNTEYNVSIVASLCGTDRLTFSLLNYVKCPALASDHGPVEVEGYRHPSIEGTTITFSCPPGLILTRSNTSSCMGNGKWEPDLRGTRCKVDCHTPIVNSNVSVNYSSTLEDSLVTFQCEDGLLPDGVFIARCYKNGTWIPNPSSHVCATPSAANCGEPLAPSDGYLEPYTSTSEGARVNQVHICQNGQLAVEEIICGLDGEWASVNNNICVIKSSSKLDTNVIIGISFGSCFGVIVSCCVVLIIIIIIKWKGTAMSSSEEQKRGQSKHQNPEYEEVMASRNDEPEKLEMMKNVAYGPLRLK